MGDGGGEGEQSASQSVSLSCLGVSDGAAMELRCPGSLPVQPLDDDVCTVDIHGRAVALQGSRREDKGETEAASQPGTQTQTQAQASVVMTHAGRGDRTVAPPTSATTSSRNGPTAIRSTHAGRQAPSTQPARPTKGTPTAVGKPHIIEDTARRPSIHPGRAHELRSSALRLTPAGGQRVTPSQTPDTDP